ncbi:hypothetical protein [Kitasatospora sp. NPDC001095]
MYSAPTRYSWATTSVIGSPSTVRRLRSLRSAATESCGRSQNDTPSPQ